MELPRLRQGLHWKFALLVILLLLASSARSSPLPAADIDSDPASSTSPADMMLAASARPAGVLTQGGTAFANGHGAGVTGAALAEKAWSLGAVFPEPASLLLLALGLLALFVLRERDMSSSRRRRR